MENLELNPKPELVAVPAARSTASNARDWKTDLEPFVKLIDKAEPGQGVLVTSTKYASILGAMREGLDGREDIEITARTTDETFKTSKGNTRNMMDVYLVKK